MTAAILDTFNTLKEKGTFLQLRVPGHGYESLVVVSDIRTALGMHLVAIDCPDGLAALLDSGKVPPALSFAFTGPDEIRYRFNPEDVFVQGQTLLITLPTRLERIQRRGDYRLTAPVGAYFYFTAGSRRKRVKMMDVSISGVSGILINVKDDPQRPLAMEKGQTLLNLKLAFTVDGREEIIPVRECEVRRFESLPQKGRVLMAVVFTRIDPEHRERLTQRLYAEQRHELKIRQERQ